MAGTKKVEPGHTVVSDSGEGAGKESSTALDGLLENNGTYQPGMAPLTNEQNEAVHNEAGNAAEGAGNSEPIQDRSSPETGAESNGVGAENKKPHDDDGDAPIPATEPCYIVLKRGATYRFRGKTYIKGKPEPAAPDIAERLLRTGMFVKG